MAFEVCLFMEKSDKLICPSMLVYIKLMKVIWIGFELSRTKNRMSIVYVDFKFLVCSYLEKGYACLGV